jgi:hypothetical protein
MVDGVVLSSFARELRDVLGGLAVATGSSEVSQKFPEVVVRYWCEKKLQIFFSIGVFCCVSLRQFLSFSDYDRRSSSASKREGAYSGVRKRTLHEAWKHGMCSSLFSSQRSCKSPADSFKEQTYAVSLRLEKNLISDLSRFKDSHGCRM